jgi:antitoxin CptB
MDDGQRSARRKRLLFRSWHRGMREMDMLLGRFADLHVDTFSDRQLALFEAILEEVDPVLYGWLSGRNPVPADMQSDVMRLLKNFTISIDQY